MREFSPKRCEQWFFSYLMNTFYSQCKYPLAYSQDYIQFLASNNYNLTFLFFIHQTL